jgi:hypothetical protein
MNESHFTAIAKRGYTEGGQFALETWALATDGHIAVLVPRTSELPQAPDSIASAVRRWIAMPPAPEHVLSIASLRAFAKQPPCATCRNTRRVTCDECHGAGGTVECECSKCGNEHEYACDCDNGKVACPSCGSSRCGFILGKKIDTRLLDDVLNAVADERDIVASILNLGPGKTHRSHSNEALVLKPHGGNPWIAFVMPMIDSTVAVVTYDDAQVTK